MTPFFGSWSDRAGEPTAKLERRWYCLRGLRVCARVSTGPVPHDAPTVVLVHGMSMSSAYMLPVAERLAPFGRVYAPDLPGYGASDKPDRILDVPELADALLAWMNAAGLDRAALLGNSLGCQVIVDLAVRFPHRVESVVLQGPTVDPHGRTAWQQAIRLLADARFEPPSHALNVIRDYLRAGPRRTAGIVGHMLADPIEEKLPYVRAPALVVRGSKDPVVPQRWAEEAAGLLPDGELREVPGGSHALTYAAPRELARISLPFMKRHHRAA